MKFRYYLFSLLITFAGAINVFAASLSIDGDKTINYNETGTVNIKLTTGGESITSIDFDLVYDNELVIDNGTTNAEWINKITNRKVNIVSTSSLPSDTVITLKVKNNIQLSKTSVLKLANIKFNGNTSDNDTEQTFTLKYTPVTTSEAKSSSPLLSKMSINAGTMSPSFNANVFAYKINIEKDTIQNITLRGTCYEGNCITSLTCETSGCSVTNNSKITLAMGKNIAHYKVTSEDGKQTKDYVFTIYRGPSAENSSYLSSLTIDDFKIKETFDKDRLDYTAVVDYEHEKININATPEDPNATVNIKGNTKLEVGENVITITVISSETGDKKIYNITVTREDFKAGSTTTTKAPIVADEKEKSGSKTWLIVLISFVGAAIIGVSGYFIFKKKKPNDKNKKALITDEGNIENKNNKLDEIDIKENELADELNMTARPFKPSVDEALSDLMQTKELELTKEINLNNDHLI